MVGLLVRTALVLSVACHWSGALGGLTEGECSCEQADGLVTSSAADHDDACQDDHESCPPDCDRCSCCGSPTATAVEADVSVAPVPPRTLAALEAAVHDSPQGERRQVFRPPRA